MQYLFKFLKMVILFPISYRFLVNSLDFINTVRLLLILGWKSYIISSKYLQIYFFAFWLKFLVLGIVVLEHKRAPLATQRWAVHK